jgi:hypothetical protein
MRGVLDLHPERPSGVIKPLSVLPNDSLTIPLARQPVQGTAVGLDAIEIERDLIL